jgi:hypothetical protein
MDPRGVGGADFLRIKKLDPPLREKAKKKGTTFEARKTGPPAASVLFLKFVSDKTQRTTADSSLTTPKLNYVCGPVRSE